jgi:hypothetical protein
MPNSALGLEQILSRLRRFYKPFVVTVLLSATSALPVLARNPLNLDTRTAPSGQKYLFVAINDAPVSFVVKKPDRNDPKILLCIPASFVTKEGKAIGVLVYNGEVHNKVNPKLGGALEIIDGSIKMIDTKSGAGLSKTYLDDLARKNGCLFQQFAIVKNRTPSSFKDNGKYLRRGVGKLADGKPIIVESKTWITLKQFASDLVALGVKDLLYTDMGPWTESWIRDPKSEKLIEIGNQKAAPVTQLNWLIVSEID